MRNVFRKRCVQKIWVRFFQPTIFLREEEKFVNRNWAHNPYANKDFSALDELYYGIPFVVLFKTIIEVGDKI